MKTTFVIVWISDRIFEDYLCVLFLSVIIFIILIYVE